MVTYIDFGKQKVVIFTQVAKNEIVKIGYKGFNFAIRKRLINQNITDMLQLAYKVRQI